MTDPNMDALAARVAALEAAKASLERQNERLKTGALLGAALAIVLAASFGTRLVDAAPPPPTKPVDGDEITLRDKDKKALATLKVQDSGQPLMAILGKDGKVRIALGLHPDGTPYLALADQDGKDRAFLGLAPDGAAGLYLMGTDGKITHSMKDEPGADSGAAGDPRTRANEAAAVGALKTLVTAQAVFREGDKENDGNLDYGMLSELGNTNIIDSVLASGTKQGYLFQATYSFSTSEFLWFAVANPQVRGKTGNRSFVTSEAGVIFYSDDKDLVLDTNSCLLPAQGVKPLGR